MSRIGKLPIQIPAGVQVTVDDKNHSIVVKGKLGELRQKVNPDIKVEVEENTLKVSRPSDDKMHRSLHGLYRALIANMVKGVSEGFTIKQEMVGVGYRATSQGQLLDISVGYSHNILMELPEEVKVSVVQEKRANPIITLTSCDKQLLGQVAAKIRSFRAPEPYKGKGIKFVGEVLRRKAGKTASSSK
ncbi:MAG: 50S ribosomal protein L6 [Bacteroidales bacterium]|jgi:large subunit ribosomal protein L6|nr:50S ribosomal protein L6 [Bacteroidales bacterium]